MGFLTIVELALGICIFGISPFEGGSFFSNRQASFWNSLGRPSLPHPQSSFLYFGLA